VSTASTFTIREATESDVPEIRRLLHPFVEEQILLPRSDGELATLSRHGFVAVASERTIGFAAVEVYSRKLAEVQGLAVAREFQGRGIGKTLVERCVERTRELNIVELMAITATDKLFESCGFHYSLPDQKRALFIQL